jgi:hypothetical protein
MAKKKAPTPQKKFSSNISGSQIKRSKGGLTKNPKKRQRKITKKKLREAGLPSPAATKIGTPKFTALQKKWYAKLQENGFKDIEWVDHTTGKGQDSDYLKGSLAKGKPWSPDRAQFFRLLQNYLTHYQFKYRRMDYYILARLNEGWTYRRIHEGCQKKYRLKKSLYWLYYHIQGLSQAMLVWNKTHTHGMLNASSARESLNDINLANGLPLEAPNGLKLDAGWWQDNMSDLFKKDSH